MFFAHVDADHKKNGQFLAIQIFNLLISKEINKHIFRINIKNTFLKGFFNKKQIGIVYF